MQTRKPRFYPQPERVMGLSKDRATSLNVDVPSLVSRPFCREKCFCSDSDRIHLHRAFLMAPVRTGTAGKHMVSIALYHLEKIPHVNKANIKDYEPFEPMTW